MRALFVSLIVLSLCLSVFAGYEDFYGGISDAFSAFEDPNTGLTVFPTLLIPIGGKLEGMGTAYTAVASDSGFIEANPAGSSVLDISELSFLHHNWIADSKIEGIIYTVRFNDLGIGVGGKFLYVPFTEYNIIGERASKGLISETIATANVSYNFFSGYHFHGLAVGANLKAAYRHIPAAIYPGQSAITAMADIGLLSRFNFLKYYYSRDKNFSVGVVLKNIGLPALGEPLPTMLSSGIAYSPIRPLLIALDFNLPISFDPVDQPAERWYIATGVDVAVTNFLSIQGGFRLKENPHVSLGSTLDLEPARFTVNYNLDLSGSLNPLDKFSVEAKLKLGDGGRADRRKQVDELYASGLEAFANGELEKAVEFWEKALEIDPKFLPARENIEMVQKHLKLQEEMLEKQKVGQ
jgi:tetratricopeptide (TPR) repeat protein